MTFLSEGTWAVGQGPDAADRKLFRYILRSMHKPDLRVLEVGFGSLIDAAAVERENLDDCQYYGIDITPEFVERGKSLYPWGDWSCGDARELEAKDGFDLVWCRHVLEHVDDGVEALHRMWLATTGALVVSWFIRPSWNEASVGCVYGDGFPHWTYSARELVELATRWGASLTRIDFDHHSSRASVWVFTTPESEYVERVARWYAQTSGFLLALEPVPLRANEEAARALDLCEEAYRALGQYIGVAERNADVEFVLRVALDALASAEAYMEPEQDEAHVQLTMRRVRDAKGRCEASLRVEEDPTLGSKDQRLRDAHRTLEDQLRGEGRLG